MAMNYKEEQRSSKVDFGSFMEDMALVCTYVPGDETGAMAHNTAAKTPPLQNSPQVDQMLSAAHTTTFSTQHRDNQGVAAFNLGAAAIVSSRRTPVASSLLVDMDEIQSTLNADFTVEDLIASASLTPPPATPQTTSAPPPSNTSIHVTAPTLPPQHTTAAPSKTPAAHPKAVIGFSPPTRPAPSPVKVPSTLSPAEPKAVTRGSRAAGHSDAPRPLGFPAPNSALRPSTSASSLNSAAPASSIGSSTHSDASNATTAADTPPGQSPSPSTGSPVISRPNTPPNGESPDGQVRQRVRPQSRLPMPANMTGGFTTFEDFLLDPNISLLKALCTCLQVTEATKTCASIAMIYESKRRTLPMIQAMIEFEVSLQKTAATLFRNNSLTTHMMTCYTKLVGLPFLKTVIGPVIVDAFTGIDAGEVTYEIDPSKLGPGEDLKTNISDLKNLVHSFFDRILNSRAVMPRNFMEICSTLQQSTVDRFPESRYFVIGGFLFLRYICPAVVAPDGYKLISATITDKQRRMLVLVSKILQTIANERTFGEKEDYMMCMNQLVNEYQGVVQYFFNQLAKPVHPDTPENVPSLVITLEDYQLALKQVLAQVKASKAKLAANPLISSDPKLSAAVENLDNMPLM